MPEIHITVAKLLYLFKLVFSLSILEGYFFANAIQVNAMSNIVHKFQKLIDLIIGKLNVPGSINGFR
jgi:hypothetical protein